MKNVVLFIFFCISIGSWAQEASTSVSTILSNATAHIDSGDREKAKALLESLRVLPLTDYQKYELQLLLRKLSKHQIGVNYEIINFQEAYAIQKSWNSIALEYQHNVGKQVFTGRATYSDRFFTDAVLYEIDAYPVFSEKMYAYVSFAASEGEFFQKFGGSASLFNNLGNGFESEVGFRYFEFETDSFFTFAGGITKYTGNFYINARAAFGPDREGTLAQNYQLTTRYYFINAANYVFIRIGSGISPSDTARFSQIVSNPSLNAFYGTLGATQWYDQFGLSGSVGLLFEDLTSGSNGTQLLGSLSVRYRFY